MPDLPQIDFEYWDDEDGWFGARIINGPKGEMIAKGMEVMAAGLKYLIDAVEGAKAQVLAGQKTGIFALEMHGEYVDGVLTIRFPTVPGFGMIFENEKAMQVWMQAFAVKSQEKRKLQA